MIFHEDKTTTSISQSSMQHITCILNTDGDYFALTVCLEFRTPSFCDFGYLYLFIVLH